MSTENTNEIKYLDLHGTEVLVDKVKDLIEKEIAGKIGPTGQTGDTGAKGPYSHAEGFSLTEGVYSHAEGEASHAEGDCSHAEGAYSHAEGNYSHAEGYESHTEGAYSHAEGYLSVTGGTATLNELNIGTDTTSGAYAHAEGNATIAKGISSHSEGQKTFASGIGSHAEGANTKAEGDYSHTEGSGSIGIGENSHAEGHLSLAIGSNSHAEGYRTITTNYSEHAEGSLNKSNKGSDLKDKTLSSIGIGSSETSRKNAFEVMQNGDIYVHGLGDYDGTNAVEANAEGKTASTLQECIPYTWDSVNKVLSLTGKIEASDGFYETSDARKKDVHGELSLDKAYDFIRNCEPILCNLKGSDKTQIGLIAQEVREFFPEIVNEDSEGYLSLDYAKLTVIILRVLKDLIDKK